MTRDRASGERSSGGPDDRESRQAFSEGAFESLYGRTFGTVWSMARRVAASDDEADDVAQSSYLTLYRYWSGGTLREPPEHLLYRVAKNRTIDLLRSKRRRLRLFERLTATRPAASGDAVATPLARALRRLRPEDASLILLQAAAGFSYGEIARIEKASIATIRSRLYRARRELAKLFDEEGGEW